MKAVEPISYIREYRHKFFRTLPVTGIDLAQRMVGDILICGSRSCHMFCIQEIWIILADRDWFGSQSEHDIFNRILAFPEAGANSTRTEVLINALSSFVWTSSRSEKTLISGEEQFATAVLEALENLSLPFEWKRVIAFKVDAQTSNI